MQRKLDYVFCPICGTRFIPKAVNLRFGDVPEHDKRIHRMFTNLQKEYHYEFEMMGFKMIKPSRDMSWITFRVNDDTMFEPFSILRSVRVVSFKAEFLITLSPDRLEPTSDILKNMLLAARLGRHEANFWEVSEPGERINIVNRHWHVLAKAHKLSQGGFIDDPTESTQVIDIEDRDLGFLANEGKEDKRPF